MATWGDWRIGTAERDAAAAALSDHYAAGRLSWEEFESRLEAAYRATTAGELAAVSADLPQPAPWQPGGGQGVRGWAASRPPVARRVRRARARLAALLALAGLVTGSVLAAETLPHGGLLVALFLLLVLPLAVVAGLVAAAVWLGRRAWRRSAWLDAVPLALGMPWLGRAVWAGRAAHLGHAYWRAGRRAYCGRGWARP